MEDEIGSKEYCAKFLFVLFLEQHKAFPNQIHTLISEDTLKYSDILAIGQKIGKGGGVAAPKYPRKILNTCGNILGNLLIKIQYKVVFVVVLVEISRKF